MHSPRSPLPLINTDKCCVSLTFRVTQARVVCLDPPLRGTQVCACLNPRVRGPCVGCATHVHCCVGYEVLSERWYGAVLR